MKNQTGILVQLHKPEPFSGHTIDWATMATNNNSAGFNVSMKGLLMGSLHRQVALLVPDEKLNCFDFWRKKFFHNKTR